MEPDKTVTIRSIGDILVHSDVYTTANAAANYEGYDFSAMFDPMRQYLEDADVTTANMEVPVAGPEFGLSGYPQFNAPPEVIDGLLDAGVDVVNTPPTTRWIGGRRALKRRQAICANAA